MIDGIGTLYRSKTYVVKLPFIDRQSALSNPKEIINSAVYLL